MEEIVELCCNISERSTEWTTSELIQVNYYYYNSHWTNYEAGRNVSQQTDHDRRRRPERLDYDLEIIDQPNGLNYCLYPTTRPLPLTPGRENSTQLQPCYHLFCLTPTYEHTNCTVPRPLIGSQLTLLNFSLLALGCFPSVVLETDDLQYKQYKIHNII